MSSQPPDSLREYGQLTQARVPLERAAEAFTTRDDTGRIPIVVIPDRTMRIAVELVLVGLGILLLGFFGGTYLQNALYPILGVVAAIALIGFVAYRACRVVIPEGVNALLAKGGKYWRTIPSGLHIIPPWVIVTHLVTRREIPFAVPIEAAPTSDSVRARLITLVTLSISEPFRFVYNISADDFDLVFQAACQDGMRSLVRGITSEQINDLPRWDLTELSQKLSAEVALYGVTITKVHITFAQPPPEFVASQEARRLAAFQRVEQEETQALAVRRQTDVDAIAQQRLLAQAQRDIELLRAQSQQAEMRRELVEMEAKAHERRLALLEERLARYPHAALWERQIEQLQVARSLAGNTRAIVQMGNLDEMIRMSMMQDSMPQLMGNPPANGASEPAAASPEAKTQDTPTQAEV